MIRNFKMEFNISRKLKLSFLRRDPNRFNLTEDEWRYYCEMVDEGLDFMTLVEISLRTLAIKIGKILILQRF